MKAFLSFFENLFNCSAKAPRILKFVNFLCHEKMRGGKRVGRKLRGKRSFSTKNLCRGGGGRGGQAKFFVVLRGVFKTGIFYGDRSGQLYAILRERGGDKNRIFDST